MVSYVNWIFFWCLYWSWNMAGTKSEITVALLSAFVGTIERSLFPVLRRPISAFIKIDALPMFGTGPVDLSFPSRDVWSRRTGRGQTPPKMACFLLGRAAQTFSETRYYSRDFDFCLIRVHVRNLFDPLSDWDSFQSQLRFNSIRQAIFNLYCWPKLTDIHFGDVESCDWLYRKKSQIRHELFGQAGFEISTHNRIRQFSGCESTLRNSEKHRRPQRFPSNFGRTAKFGILRRRKSRVNVQKGPGSGRGS